MNMTKDKGTLQQQRAFVLVITRVGLPDSADLEHPIEGIGHGFVLNARHFIV